MTDSRPAAIDPLPFTLHSNGGKRLEYVADAGVGLGRQTFHFASFQNEGLFKAILGLMEQYRALERSVGGLEKKTETLETEKAALEAEIHSKDAKLAEQERRLGRSRKAEA